MYQGKFDSGVFPILLTEKIFEKSLYFWFYGIIKFQF